jgi:transcriptional regulator with XRE-family HTH domain
MRAIQRFGKQLQQVRTRRSLTQEQLAVTAGLSRTFLARLELGQHDPSLSTLVRGESVEDVSDRIIRRERQCEPVVAGRGGSLFDARRCGKSRPHSKRDVHCPLSEQTRRSRTPPPPGSRNEIISSGSLLPHIPDMRFPYTPTDTALLYSCHPN